MKIIETYTVPSLHAPTRLSDLPAGSFVSLHSRKAFKKAVKKGLVLLNDLPAKTADFVVGGERIIICKDETLSKKPKINIPLDILYEDDYLAVIQKPAGVEVSGNKKYTLENALPLALQPSKASQALDRPLPAHRLDYPTSGALVVAKTTQTLLDLHTQFKEHRVHKTYIAVTIGHQKTKGTITLPIEEKASKSEFKVIKTIPSKKYDALNLVLLKPITGRRHQLRKHLSSINNPILGDKDYFIEGKVSTGNGLYLHAIGLTFQHPITKEILECYCPPTKKFEKLFSLQSLENLVFTKPQ